MSIFRVEKNANYTVISNYHLRDKNLSLKSIGLLSLILSLPETWDYSQAGLATICKDGEDSIRSGLKELEKYGYLERERERDDSGRMRGIIYHIYEVPKNKREKIGNTVFGEEKVKSKNIARSRHSVSPKTNLLEREIPMLDKPSLDSPIFDSPGVEHPTQVNEGQLKDIEKDIRNTEEPNTEFLNVHPSIYLERREDVKMDDNRDAKAYMRENSRPKEIGESEIDKGEQRKRLKKTIMDNVGYEFFEFKYSNLENKLEDGKIDVEEYDKEMLTYDLRTINRVVEHMLDVLLSLNTDPIKIGNELIDREVVRGKLIRVGIQEMKRVIYELNTNPTIKNPKNYAISMLYNS